MFHFRCPSSPARFVSLAALLIVTRVMPAAGTPLYEALSASFTSAGMALPTVLMTSVSPAVNVALLRETDALAVQPSAVARRLQARKDLVALGLTLAHDTGDTLGE